MSVDRGQTCNSVWTHLMQVPFQQAYTDVNGLRTRYVQAGSADKPALLLIHGTGGHWEAFCANLEALSQHFNCYAPDMMGCGFTDKPDKPYEIADYMEHLLGFMDKMKIQRAAFVGISLGSWVVTRLALAHPDRIDRMILISPPGLVPLRPSSAATVSSRQASANNPSWENVSAVMSRLFFNPSQMMDDLVAVRQRVYSLPGIQRIMPRMLTLFDPEIRARNNLSEAQWRSIKTTTLVVVHVDTDDLYLETARKILHLLPNATGLEMKQTGHWSNYEDAATFNKAAIAFLSQ